VNAVSAQRLQDLRAAHIVNLPTARRRAWYGLLAALLAAAAVVIAWTAVTEKPMYWIGVAVFAFAGFGYVYAAWEVTAQLRSPPAAAFADESSEWEAAGVTAFDTAANVSLQGAGVLDIALGLAGEQTFKVYKRRKPRHVERWLAETAGDLLADEQPLLVCQALLVPHGLRRLLMWPALGLAGPGRVRLGCLTVTDERLMFHRRTRFGRGPYRLHLAEPLAELEVVEWYEGQYVQANYHVLVLRISGGRAVRFNIHKVWAEEAQLAFELVASCTTRPPAFLAARWGS
jgi:hypothetical protein